MLQTTAVDHLDIRPHRAAVQGAEYGVAAVAQTEMQSGMIAQNGLAMTAEVKHRRFLHAVFPGEPLPEQHVGPDAALPVGEKAVGHSLLIALRGKPPEIGLIFFVRIG